MEKNAQSKIIPLASAIFVIGLVLTIIKLLVGKNHREAKPAAMTPETSPTPLPEGVSAKF